MEYVKLNNGVEMPVLGLGTYEGTDKGVALRSVRDALEVGYRLIDTALRFLIQQGVTVIPKSARRERMEQNIDVFDFQLTEEEMQRLAAFDRRVPLTCDRQSLVLPGRQINGKGNTLHSAQNVAIVEVHGILTDGTFVLSPEERPVVLVLNIVGLQEQHSGHHASGNKREVAAVIAVGHIFGPYAHAHHE